MAVRSNPLMWPFLFQNLVTSIAFLAFGWTKSVSASTLYKLTFIHSFTSWWGVIAILAVTLALVGLQVKLAGIIGGYLGLIIWLYAFCLFVPAGYFYQAILALPQIYFWVWYQYRMTKYYRG